MKLFLAAESNIKHKSDFKTEKQLIDLAKKINKEINFND